MAFFKQLCTKQLQFQLPKKPPPCFEPVNDSERWEHDVQVVSRAEWGALPPRTDDHATPLPWPHPCVLWTFSQTEECFDKEDCSRVMRSIQQRHIEMGLPDIQYNFYVGGDLNIYEGRGWNTQSGCVIPGFSQLEKMHCALAYIGRYEHQNYPSQKVLEVRKAFVLYGMEHDFIDYEYSNLCLTSTLDQYK